MDELERALRGVLTDERLDVPVAPGAIRAIRDGIRRRRRRRTASAVMAVVTVVSAGAATAVLARPTSESIRPGGRVHTPTSPPLPQVPANPVPPVRRTVVPWSDIAYDPAKPPVFPGAVADPGTPWCTAHQLSLDVLLEGGTGNLLGGAVVRNTSTGTCALSGQPLVDVRTSSGRVLVASQPDDFYVDAWVKLPPRAEAWASIEWAQEFCSEPAPARITVTLPHGGGVLGTGSTASPRCNSPTAPPTAGSLHVNGFVRRGADQNDDVFTPEAAMQATVDRFARSVVAGGLVTYQLQMAGTSAAVALDPCLPFRERLVDQATGAVVAEELHTLNCAAAPATIDPSNSSHRVGFQLRLRVPTSVAPGSYALVWQSVLRPVHATADGSVHVRAGPPPCGEGQLTLSRGRSGAAAGRYADVVVFTNDTPNACTLRGYPGVQFVDRSGRSLVTEPHHGSGGPFFDAPMTTVVLPAHGGAASFALGGADFAPPAGAAPCTPTRGVLVIPPNLHHQVLVAGVGQDCEHGSVDVSVVVPGRRGPRPG